MTGESMRIDLRGRRALVTGSTSGMGNAIAKGMAEAGAAVVVHGRSDERVTEACTRLAREVPGAELSGHAAELADADAVNRLIADVPQVDILVNNAGPIGSQPFFEATDEEWQHFLDVYVMAAVRLARHHAHRMIERGRGRVLFSAGVTAGFTPGADDGRLVCWGTCKAALLGLSRGLAETAAGTGVTVNAFIPGPTHTEASFMTRAQPPPGTTFAQIEQEYFGGAGSSSILRRFIRPSEVADFVVFLASDQASAITGAALRVDGGMIRSIP
jgi:NAD(P)-dependent dehydrogenase (short-subunit alcohol dehydrogenase family)